MWFTLTSNSVITDFSSALYGGGPAESVVDHTHQVIRIRKVAEGTTAANSPFASSNLSSSASPPQSPGKTTNHIVAGLSGHARGPGKQLKPAKALRLPGKKSKVPRPPNAFILYRQKHHPLVMAAHPGMKNNDISILLGQQWKAEAEDVKAEYKALADKMKLKHAAENPGYQYAPRKASEKKRRMTVRKLAKLRLSDGGSETQSNPDVDTDDAKGAEKLALPEHVAADGTTLRMPVSVTEMLNAERPSYPGYIEYNGVEKMSLTLPAGHSQVERDYMLNMGSGAEGLSVFDDNARSGVYTDMDDFIATETALMHDATDWEAITHDIEYIRAMKQFLEVSTTNNPKHPKATEPSGSILNFDDEMERQLFQERLDAALWMLE
ncbi:hypothetical protein ABEF95_012032 [Exophiala dermatitidis]